MVMVAVVPGSVVVMMMLTRRAIPFVGAVIMTVGVMALRALITMAPIVVVVTVASLCLRCESRE